MRKILHVDMDAFFASVEQRDNPKLLGKPIAVGFDGPRGVVSTASYEARKFGVHSAMAMSRAKTICPGLIIVPHHGESYKEASNEVRKIFTEYTDLIEPISIDEAFLDVTENKKDMPIATDIAREIKLKIKERTGLTASAGVSYNKFLAKIASDYNKPDGLFVIKPQDALNFIGQLPIGKFWGVGPKTEQMMNRIGIFTGAELRRVSKNHLIEVFGKTGNIYYNFARGVDPRPVINAWERKSVGCEHTFLEDISIPSAILIELYHTVMELLTRIKKAEFKGKTLTLKIKFADFQQITHSATSDKILEKKKDILPLAKKLLKQTDLKRNAIRLIGLSVSNPSEDEALKEQWYEGWLFKD